MKPDLQPFTTWLDFEAGILEPDRATVERRLSDMKGMYLEESGGDDLVYRVHLIPVPQENSEIQCSTTVMQPGKVGREFYMTKGHFHEVRDRSEIYIGLAGSGKLLMATEDGEWVVEPIEPGSVSYVPGGWAHRSVNVGDDELVFFAAYVGDAGHDYGTIEAQGFPMLIVGGPEGPEVIPNPRYRGRT